MAPSTSHAPPVSGMSGPYGPRAPMSGSYPRPLGAGVAGAGRGMVPLGPPGLGGVAGVGQGTLMPGPPVPGGVAGQGMFPPGPPGPGSGQGMYPTGPTRPGMPTAPIQQQPRQRIDPDHMPNPVS